MTNRRNARTAYGYITVGLELAITVLLFVLGGYKLDEYFDKSPVFVSIGAFLGMGLGFYHLIKRLNEITEMEKREKDKEKDNKRAKWM